MARPVTLVTAGSPASDRVGEGDGRKISQLSAIVRQDRAVTIDEAMTLLPGPVTAGEVLAHCDDRVVRAATADGRQVAVKEDASRTRLRKETEARRRARRAGLRIPAVVAASDGFLQTNRAALLAEADLSPSPALSPLSAAWTKATCRGR